ncbi:MAG: hypothetical protein VX941_05500 [Pseudomonadota bacterium]|nr:hypothetical protein [Pseudomonadota bacterium]
MHKNFKAICAILLAIGLSAVNGQAEAGSEVDAKIKKALITPVNRVLVDLATNVQRTATTSFSGFITKIDDSSIRDDYVIFSPRLEGETEASLNEEFSIGMKGYLSLSTDQDTVQGWFNGPGQNYQKIRYADLTAAWLKYEAENYELILGKDVLSMGLLELHSPSDRFGLWDGSDPSSTTELGVWHLGLNYFIDDDTVSFKFLPFDKKSISPGEGSRWAGTSGSSVFLNLPTGSSVVDFYHPTHFENMGYLALYEGAREGIDFFGFAHHGPSSYSVLSSTTRNVADPNSLVLERVNPISISTGAGLSRVIDEWKFTGEVVYQRTYNGRDEDFIRYGAGFSYTDSRFANFIGLEKITSIAEFSGDEIISDAYADDWVQSSKLSRPFRRTVFLRVVVEHNEELSYFAGSTVNIKYEDHTFGAGVEYRPNDNFKIQMSGAFFEGNSDTHFGRWTDNELIRLGAEYSF